MGLGGLFIYLIDRHQFQIDPVLGDGRRHHRAGAGLGRGRGVEGRLLNPRDSEEQGQVQGRPTSLVWQCFQVGVSRNVRKKMGGRQSRNLSPLQYHCQGGLPLRRPLQRGCLKVWHAHHRLVSVNNDPKE